MFRFVLVLGVGLGLTGCAARVVGGFGEQHGVSRHPSLGYVRIVFVGTFNSRAENKADAQYYAIQLMGCSVDAPELGNGCCTSNRRRCPSSLPYRQRLYVLRADETAGTAETEIYALTQPDAAIGLCADDERATFRETDVSLRAGCGVFLTWSPPKRCLMGNPWRGLYQHIGRRYLRPHKSGCVTTNC